jgi:quinol monooxygenase YgiN
VSSWPHLLVSALLLVANPGQQAGAPLATDTRFYAVAYVEAIASASPKASALLKQYRDASTKQDGLVSLEVFEQIGRPGHFAVFEVWRDRKAFDARDTSAQKQLRDALQPIRVSDYDERPYKTITLDDRRDRLQERGDRIPREASADRGNPGGGSQAAQVIVITHVDVAPNPQVAVMLKDLAEASRKEAGSVRFDVVQHTMRANHFTVVEVWRDQKALDAHVAAAHTKQYRDALQPMTGSPLDERVYKAIE